MRRAVDPAAVGKLDSVVPFPAAAVLVLKGWPVSYQRSRANRAESLKAVVGQFGFPQGRFSIPVYAMMEML